MHTFFTSIFFLALIGTLLMPRAWANDISNDSSSMQVAVCISRQGFTRIIYSLNTPKPPLRGMVTIEHYVFSIEIEAEKGVLIWEINDATYRQIEGKVLITTIRDLDTVVIYHKPLPYLAWSQLSSCHK